MSLQTLRNPPPLYVSFIECGQTARLSLCTEKCTGAQVGVVKKQQLVEVRSNVLLVFLFLVSAFALSALEAGSSEQPPDLSIHCVLPCVLSFPTKLKIKMAPIEREGGL